GPDADPPLARAAGAGPRGVPALMRRLWPFAAFVPAAALARPPAADILAALHKKVHLHGAAISRDGKRVAWVEQVTTPDGRSPDRSTIQVAALDAPGRPPRIVTAKPGGPWDEREPAFSPDGRRLVFLSDAARRHQPELVVADLTTGSVTQL